MPIVFAMGLCIRGLPGLRGRRHSAHGHPAPDGRGRRQFPATRHPVLLPGGRVDERGGNHAAAGRLRHGGGRPHPGRAGVRGHRDERDHGRISRDRAGRCECDRLRPDSRHEAPGLRCRLRGRRHRGRRHDRPDHPAQYSDDYLCGRGRGLRRILVPRRGDPRSVDGGVSLCGDVSSSAVAGAIPSRRAARGGNWRRPRAARPGH